MTATTATTTNDKVNANSGPGSVIQIVGQAARAGKYKLGARVGKYKLRARAGKHRLGLGAGGRARARARGLEPGFRDQSKGCEPGNTNTLFVRSFSVDEYLISYISEYLIKK